MSVPPPVYLRVAVLWHDTLFAEAIVDAARPVTIGEDPDNTLVVPDLAGVGATHLLFAADVDGCRLYPTDAMAGRLCLDDGDPSPLGELRTPDGIAIGMTSWGVIDLAERLSIFFQAVDAPDRVPPIAPWQGFEPPVLGSLLAAITLHLGFLIAAFLLWDIQPALASLDLSDRPFHAISEPPIPPIEPEALAETLAEEQVEETAKQAGGEEGEFGEPDKTEKSKVPEREGELVDRVRDIGVHEALGSDLLGRGPLQHVFGDKTGFDNKLAAATAGGGDVLIIGAGTGGMGLRGTGTGGGAEGFGRVGGMSRLDTGPGRAPRSRLGGKPRRVAKVRVRPGTAGLTGFCKEADITRVVGARQKGISYCYEKELARSPDLQGKVTLSWRILLDGKVGGVMVENSTLGNGTVDDCLVRQVRRWSFPAPEGGMCQVRFPFVFNAGG